MNLVETGHRVGASDKMQTVHVYFSKLRTRELVYMTRREPE